MEKNSRYSKKRGEKKNIMATRINKLPKEARKGQQFELSRTMRGQKRILTFEYTGKPRLKWKIVGNKKV